MVSIIVPVTNFCPGECRYCYMGCNLVKRDIKLLPIDTLKNALNKLPQEGEEVSLSFLGGEPTFPGFSYEMVSKLEKEVKQRRNLRIRNSMETNGYYLTKEFLNFLVDEMDMHIGVSIDGPEEFHDMVRGKGSHKIAMNALRLIKEKRGSCGINAVVSTVNVNHPLEFYDFIRENEISGCKLSPCMPVENERDLMPKQLQYLDFMFEIFKRWYSEADNVKNKLEIIPISPLTRLIETERLVKIGKLAETEEGDSGFIGGMCMGNSYYIKFDGTITPCPSLDSPQFYLGNVNNISSLEDITSSPIYDSLKKMRQASIDKCVSGQSPCSSFKYCKGGCPGETFHCEKTFDGEYPNCEERLKLIHMIKSYI